MPGQTAQHVGRVVRLVLFTLLSSALFVNTINAWAVRYPLIGVGLALLEVLYRTAVPVETVESLTAADPDLELSKVKTAPATPGAAPMTGITLAPGHAGTASNPPAPSDPGA